MSLRRVLSTFAILASVVVLAGCSSNGDNPASPNVPTDNSAPAAPVVLGSSFDSGHDAIDWNASASSNVAGYEIYFYSPSPARDNSFVLLGQVDAGQTDFVLPNGAGTQYYRVRAISATGARSAPSATVTVERTLESDGDPGVPDRMR